MFIGLSVKNYKSRDVDITIKTILPGDIKTVTINSQTWMSENLDVTHYLNGDPIPQVQGNEEWDDLTTGAWCYYNSDSAKGEVYGKRDLSPNVGMKNQKPKGFKKRRK